MLVMIIFIQLELYTYIYIFFFHRSRNLDLQQQSMVEAAYFTVKPPERSAPVKKVNVFQLLCIHVDISTLSFNVL